MLMSIDGKTYISDYFVLDHGHKLPKWFLNDFLAENKARLIPSSKLNMKNVDKKAMGWTVDPKSKGAGEVLVQGYTVYVKEDGELGVLTPEEVEAFYIEIDV